MAINSKLAALVAAPAVALALPAVQAQEGTTPPDNTGGNTGFQQGFSARLGLNNLTDGDTEDFVGGSGLFGGLSYGLKNNGRVDLDFNRQSDDGNKINSFGISYTQLFPFGQGGFYGGLGLGLYRVSADVEGTGGGGGGGGYYYLGVLGLGDPSGVNETKTKLGGKALLGYNFSDKFFGELSYTKIGKVEGADPSSISLALGLRF